MKFHSDKFAYQIKHRRVMAENISMDKACIQIGISKATLSRCEKGNTPDMDTFVKIVEWLGTKPTFFIN